MKNYGKATSSSQYFSFYPTLGKRENKEKRKIASQADNLIILANKLATPAFYNCISFKRHMKLSDRGRVSVNANQRAMSMCINSTRVFVPKKRRRNHLQPTCSRRNAALDSDRP